LKNLRNSFLKFILFKEPKKTEKFILEEHDRNEADVESKRDKDIKDNKNEKKQISRRKIKSKNLLLNKNKYRNKEEKDSKNISNSKKISADIKENLKYMKNVYSIPENSDIILREFDVVINEKAYESFLLFYDGLADRKMINDNILHPLMLLSNIKIKDAEPDIGNYVGKHLITQNQLKITSEYSTVIDEINFGSCGVFINGIDKAYVADVKGWEHRNIERPNTEIVIKGPQEGFNEVLRINTALVRKIMKDENLIVEDIIIGKRSRTPCSLMYIKNIINDSLLKEIKRRLNSISIDYLINSGQLKQLIEENTYFPVPQVLDTEKPDRVAFMLSEGRAAVLIHGSPFALIMPVTITSFIHSSEDSHLNFPYVNFLRLLRLVAIIFTMLLPGLYLAIITYHHEMIPTDLLLAIEASREKVPFPSIVELLIMETAFELIREAGVRIPGPIGPTLGIIGALILGEAAVAASIVSPILIIVVAVTGIGSFAIPNFSFAFSFRLLKFAYIILGSLGGFHAISFGIFVHALILARSVSFGVPFLAPFGPVTKGTFLDEITRAPIWKQEERPDFLNTKDKRRQPKVSRGWTGE